MTPYDHSRLNKQCSIVPHPLLSTLVTTTTCEQSISPQQCSWFDPRCRGKSFYNRSCSPRLPPKGARGKRAIAFGRSSIQRFGMPKTLSSFSRSSRCSWSFPPIRFVLSTLAIVTCLEGALFVEVPVLVRFIPWWNTKRTFAPTFVSKQGKTVVD